MTYLLVSLGDKEACFCNRSKNWIWLSTNGLLLPWGGLPVHEVGCICTELQLCWLYMVSFSIPGQTCGHPGDISGGSVAPTAAWMFDSYATYQCNSPTLSLVGNSHRKCLGDGPNVWWDGEPPVCRGKSVTRVLNSLVSIHRNMIWYTVTPGPGAPHVLLSNHWGPEPQVPQQTSKFEWQFVSTQT